ncbi:MAG: hypothetical protein V7678_02425 [Brevundimonas sp.]
MKTFSMGEALGSGFGMIAKRPLAVLLWGALLYLPGIVSIVAMWALLGDDWMTPGATGDLSDPEAFNAFLQLQGWSGLSNVLSLIVQALIGVAVIRLVLWPRTSGWAGLRLGRVEFFYIVVQIAIWIGLGILTLLVVLLAVFTGIAFRGAGSAAQPLIWSVLGAVGFGLFLWAWARTGLISVASVDRKTLAFEEGWRMAGGQSFKLAVMGVLSTILCIIVFLPVVALAALSVGLAGVDWAAFADAGTWTMTWDARLMIGFGLALLFIFAGTGAATAVAYAPWASAYRQLRAPADEAHPESS